MTQRCAYLLLAIAVATLTTALLGYAVRPANAQGTQGEYTGVDIVFVVDQSGSMGGLRYGSTDHPKANDPYDLRFSGIQEMVERLASYRIKYYADREGMPSSVVFQAAVLYFGSQTQEVVPPMLIAFNTEAEWEPVAAQILPRLSAEAFPTNLGNTDHLGALRAAKALLQRMERTWQGGRHLQAIVMLTDGESYVECPAPPAAAPGQPPPPPVPQPEYCRDGRFQLYLYRNLVADYVRAELPSPRYRFYMAAINEDLPVLPDFWKTVTDNRAELVSANTMWAFIEGILGELTVENEELPKTIPGEMEEIPTTVDRVPVRPYLQEIRFIVHKPSPEARVLFRQNGILLETIPTTLVEGKNKFIESITIPRPRPGFIDIERPVTTEILRIFVLKINAQAKCDPIGAVPELIPFRLRCVVVDREGKPLEPYGDPQYELTVEAQIHGRSQSQRLRLDAAGGNTYESYFVPAQAGDYTYIIEARTKDPEGKEITPFREPLYGVGSFVVSRASARLQVEGPPTALLPVPVNIRLADTAGNPLTIPVEARHFVTMTARFVGPQGFQTDVALKLESDGYKGTLTPIAPGPYRVWLRGDVRSPETGERFTAFDQEIDTLEVLPPKVVWEGFTTPWPQYRPAPVAFFLTDQAGRSLADQTGPDIQLEAQAAVQGSSGREPITLEVVEKGRWKGEYVPANAGEYELQVSVSARQGQGAPVALVENLPLWRFSIRPMTLVNVAVRRPTDQANYPWRDIFWRPRPLTIEVAITDREGQALPPSQILQNPAAAPFTARLIPPGGGSGQPLTLAQSGEAPGVFVASFADYEPYRWYAHRDLGWWEIEIVPAAELNEAHTYGAAERWSARVHLTRHPLWWVLPLVTAVLLGACVAWAAGKTYVYLWPIAGTLAIEGSSFSRRLRDYGRHTLVFTGKDGLPANLRRVKIHRPFGSKSVRVEAQTKAGHWALRVPAAFPGFRAPAARHYITYSLGAGEKPPTGLAPSWQAYVFGLLGLLFLAGLGFVGYAVIVSLGG